MRVYRAAAAIVAGGLLTSPAFAADQIYAAKDWSGIFLGISAGYHNGDITQSGCIGSCFVDPKLQGFVAASSPTTSSSVSRPRCPSCGLSRPR